MSQRLHQTSIGSSEDEEEELLVTRRTDGNIRAMLNDSRLDLPLSRQEMRIQAARLTAQMYAIEAARRRPHTQDLLDSLAKTRAALALLKWRLFRMNEFPVEILERIFILATSTQPFAGTPKTRARIASVCSYWRQTALNLSKLWSIIYVTTRRPPFSALYICLQRAKTQPLSVYIDQRNRNWSGSEADYRCSPSDMRALMLSIVSVSNQLRELVIFADTWSEILAVQMVLQSVAPPRHLQRLEIHRTGNAYVQLQPGTIRPSEISKACLFGGSRAPMLNHLVLDGVYIDYARAPFRSLVVFELRKMAVEHMPSMTEFLQVLHGSPYLEELAFEGACPRLPDFRIDKSDWKPVTLVRLHDLRISNLMPDYARSLLKLFAAPELRYLTLERLIGADFTIFVQHLVGRFPKVTTLTVNGLNTNDGRLLAAWLLTMPVRHLKVACVPEQFFEALRVPIGPVESSQSESRRSFVCPQLETCEVLDCTFIEFEAFKHFCAGRKQSLRGILIHESDLESMEPAKRKWLVDTRMLRKLLQNPDVNDG